MLCGWQVEPWPRQSPCPPSNCALPDACHAAGSRSQPVVLDTGRHGYGRWCAEVVEGLGLMTGQAPAPAHLGVCLGGAALLDLAAIWPEAVGGAALVVPLGLEPGKPACFARLR